MAQSMHGIHSLSRALGNPLVTSEVARPFLDIEKDRNRLMALRTWAAPLGAVGMHLSMLPAKYVAPAAAAAGASSVSPASAILEHLGMNGPWQAAAPAATAAGAASMAPAAAATGDFGSTIAGHMGPIFILGSLGALGGMGAAYGVSKLMRHFAKRKAMRKLQETPYQNPILGM